MTIKQPPPSTRTMVERVAILIDPDCWRAGTEFGQRLLTRNMFHRREDSLRKAEQIVLLLKAEDVRTT